MNKYLCHIGSFIATGLILLSLMVGVKANQIPGPAEKPNILWIIIEDMSPDLGYLGHEMVKTPNIDALAEKGMRLTNVFTTGVACSPSRTALVTGFYQNYIGAYHMRYPDDLKPALPDTIEPIHIHLKELGYQTANIRSSPGNGKTDWLFDFDANSYDYAKWEEINKEQPFFARINLRLTHRPFVEDIQNPVDPKLVMVPPYYPDHIVAKKDIASYYESIQVMDGQVGQIISDLKAHNLDDNTIIFFFSDHGRPMTRCKNYLYDSGTHVPLLISSLDDRWRTALELTGRNESLYSLIDVTATTYDIAGADHIKTQGVSVFKTPEGRDFTWAAADRIGEIYLRSRMVRTKDYKLIRNFRHDLSVNAASTAYRKAVNPVYHLFNIMNELGELNSVQKKLVEPMVAVELYDVNSDPFEIVNLAENPEYQEIVENLNLQLEDFSQGINDQGLQEDSPLIAASFENYGKSSMDKNKMRILELRKEVANQVENSMK